MFQTKVTFAPGQTPEQRKAHAAHWRREDARRRAINNGLGFWRVCSKPPCRRNRTCSSDMHACFTRHWSAMPEERKEYLRGCMMAARDGNLSKDAIHRAGLAARDKFLALTTRNETPSAQRLTVEPVAETPPAPDVRIRRL
jgi:hypothetical protein